MLHHAYENVPYYRYLFGSVGVKPEDIKCCNDMSKIPITTKSQLKNAKNEITARNIDLSACVEHKTSGSTGIPLTLYFLPEDALYSRGTYERARSENGFRGLRDSLLYIGSPYVIPKDLKWYMHFGIRRKEGLNVFAPLDVQLQILKKVKPDALYGYPSAIKLIAEAIQHKGSKIISPRLIFTASEYLDPETRSFIKNSFNCDLIDIYGAWEMGCMAWECSEHAGYHLNMDKVLMEFIDESGNSVNAGERGKVIVTNLHSFAMPIIRYEIGDFAIPTYEECPCGRGGYLIREIEGRFDDFIRLKSNKLIAPPVIWSTVKSISGISEFKVVQEKEDDIVVFIVKMEEFRDTAIVEKIEKALKRVLGDDINIDTKIAENIPREKSGKLRSVVSKV